MTNTRPSGQNFLSYSVGARVGLEPTFLTVMEDVGVVELCAVVFEPDIGCPIKFPFNVQLYTADESVDVYSSRKIGALSSFLIFHN